MSTPRRTSPGLALVTGASTDIGRELARRFAADGYTLVVTADEPAIGHVADELASGSHVRVVPVRADLTDSAEVERLVRVAERQDELLTALVLDAGSGTGARTSRGGARAEDSLRVIDLRVRSIVHLACLTLSSMARRRQGHVLVLLPALEEAPGSHHATYAASKAFLRTWTDVLRAELGAQGVTVTTLEPGPRDGGARPRVEAEGASAPAAAPDHAAQVAGEAYEALMAGRDQVVLGSRRNLVQSVVAAVVPDRLAARAALRQVTQAGSDD